ncbi:MAG: hypothetical protein QGH94_05355, partial [Phycisphaerae bacterium]|nr:hypothetical protein [Phycisphaerae bacterium]
VMGLFCICLFIFILQVSVILSAHSDSTCTLAQRAAIAQEEIESLKREMDILRQQLDKCQDREQDRQEQDGSEA